MQEGKEDDTVEEKTKELLEHAYRASMGTLSAFRAMLPEPPSNSKALNEFRNAQREALLAARSFIDAQIAFLDRFDGTRNRGSGRTKVKKVEVRGKK